jgi:S-adenosylmethionine:tRNA ribosyltransferase-isomerase
MRFEEAMKEYWYELPETSIALEPNTPVDECKLLVINSKTQTMTIDVFKNISNYIEPKSSMVMNDSKVVPARVIVHKQTGGKVELLVFAEDLVNHSKEVRVFSNTKLLPKQELYSEQKQLLFTVSKQEENLFYLSCNHSEILNYLHSHGTMPIPPYLKKTSLTNQQLHTVYQPLQAKNEGSSAAATASLHFSDRVFKSIESKQIDILHTTLHVGLGTFSPLKKTFFDTKKLHTEWYSIPENITNMLKQKKSKVTAVGTTVVRTLETYAKTGEGSGLSDIFITPGHDFTHVDSLITNFHVPSSSLMMLVQAFLTYKGFSGHITQIYEFALKHDFKFLSFGDAMVIL